LIRHLKHTEIDKAKWDRCIEQAPNGFIYALSWYLDVVSPGWEALTDGEYDRVMPLPVKKKMGLKYITQPILTQQLGIMGKSVDEATILEFIRHSLKYFGVVRLNLNHTNLQVPAFASPVVKNNFVLKLDDSYEVIRQKYSKYHQRNVRHSEANNLFFKRETDVESLMVFIRQFHPYTFAEEVYPTIRQLLQTVIDKGCGAIYSAYGSNQEKLATVFILEFKGRNITILSTQTPAGRNLKATFFLLDQYIRLHANSHEVVDFEGSNIPGIADFFMGFGSDNQPYAFISITSYAALIRQILRLD
jgi:hypothetical protein